MLFIYGALTVGGIETFFLRMAKERTKLGLPTSILLLSKPERSDKELLEEMKKNANVLFPQDLFSMMPGFSSKFPLLSPVKQNVLLELFSKVDQIHVYDGMHALLGDRFNKITRKNIPVTVGFYHYIKYLWGGDNVPYFEKLNRKFIFEYLPKEALLLFSKGNKDIYTRYKKINFEKAQVFRLGVVEKKYIELSGSLNTPLEIVTVGRLVEFKTYNFYMLEVLKKLKTEGVIAKFDIYGDGPLKNIILERIRELGLVDLVALKGTLDYSSFDETISKYDLFIGSGTAIIQAASLGVPSIVGVENVIQPKTYGYFSDVHQYEYNLKGLDLPLVSVQDVIEEYVSMDENNRLELKKSHRDSVEAFTNESCQISMDALKNIKMHDQSFKYNRWVYELSRVIDRINMKLKKKHPRLTQFEDFRKLNEEA
jgi:glycosyltransferase involved in cell wall biosynthesis